MSKIWMLTRVLLKTNFLMSESASNKKKKNKKLSYVVIAILFAFIIGSLGIPIILGLDFLLEIVPAEKLILSIIFPLACITTIVFGVFSIINVFYMSKDLEHLLPLPLKPKDIMISKFFVSLINEYYILFMFILPCLIGVGIGIDAGVLYYIYTLLIFILLPIIPSVIIMIIILLMTRIFGVIKNKDTFMYVSMGIIILFSLGYNYVVQNVISVDVNSIGNTLQSLENGVMPYFEKIFFFYNSALVALINYNNINGLFSFIAFLGFNILSLIIIYVFGDKLYLKSLTITRGAKSKNKRVDEIIDKYKINNRSSFKWLMKKEWLIIKRTPIFMLNIVIIIFLMPVILVLSFVMAYLSGGEMSNNQFNQLDISNYINDPFVYLIVMVVAIFFTCTSICAATAISREGSSACMMKVIPISYFKQINIKVLFSVMLDLIGVVLIGIIPISLYEVPIYYVVLVFVPLVILVFLLNYFNIYIDLKRPKLKWDQESAAVKENLNAFLSMLLTWGVSLIFVILAVVFYLYNIQINVILLSVVISAISGCLLALVIYKFYKNSDKLLENVD